MKSLIEQICVATFPDIKANSISKNDSTRQIEEFMRKLEPDMRETFVTLMEQEIQAACTKNVDFFRTGFQKGVQLMIEVFGSFATDASSK